MAQTISARRLEMLRVLSGRDDWWTSAEAAEAGGAASPAGAGVMLRKLARWGLVSRKSVLHEPTRWRLTVHGQRVLEEKMAAGIATRGYE